MPRIKLVNYREYLKGGGKPVWAAFAGKGGCEDYVRQINSNPNRVAAKMPFSDSTSEYATWYGWSWCNPRISSEYDGNYDWAVVFDEPEFNELGELSP